MKKIYLCCPYSHPNESERLKRFEYANKAAAYLMLRGYVVFSPISHSHSIANYIGNHLSHDFWLKQDFAFIDWADELYVLMLPGWKDSVGIGIEIEKWKTEKKTEIVYLDPEVVYGKI